MSFFDLSDSDTVVDVDSDSDTLVAVDAATIEDEYEDASMGGIASDATQTPAPSHDASIQASPKPLHAYRTQPQRLNRLHSACTGCGSWFVASSLRLIERLSQGRRNAKSLSQSASLAVIFNPTRLAQCL